MWAFGLTVTDSVLITEKTEGDKDRRDAAHSFPGKKLFVASGEQTVQPAKVLSSDFRLAFYIIMFICVCMCCLCGLQGHKNV